MKWLKRAGALMFLGAWTLVVGEAFVRVAAPQPLMPRYVTGAPWGVRTNVAGAVYQHVTPDVRVTYRINRWGMRDDRDFSRTTPAGTCRIALFGDSYAVGYELPLKDTFGQQLEAALRAKGRNVEVLNFGVSGFGTAESLRTYEALGRQFNPDLVLMQWQVTDFDDNSRAGLYVLDHGELRAGASRYLPGVAAQDWLMRFRLYRMVADSSQFYNFLREQIGWQGKQFLALWSKRQAGAADNEVENGEYAISPAQAELSGALLMKARAEANADGSRFIVYDIPNRTPPTVFSSSYDLISAKVRKQLPAVSPLLAFRSAAAHGQHLFYSAGARHLTPLGAHLLTTELVRRIDTDGALEHCKADGSNLPSSAVPGA